MPNHIECIIDVATPDMRFRDVATLHEIFKTGRIMVDGFNSKSVERLEVLTYIEKDSDNYKLTQSGLKIAIDHYKRDVANGNIIGELVVNYFRCLPVPAAADNDFPILACSNDRVTNYIQLLMVNGNLDIITNGSNVFKLIDFIDEYTGETHLLYPDDTVIMHGAGGYVVHKFSE